MVGEDEIEEGVMKVRMDSKSIISSNTNRFLLLASLAAQEVKALEGRVVEILRRMGEVRIRSLPSLRSPPPFSHKLTHFPSSILPMSH